jgi:eukaryotic-like serine/threonine-protein kinase
MEFSTNPSAPCNVLAPDFTIALTVILAGGAGEMLGHRLSHYTIVERIGAGGMGVVYRAHDEQLDRDVAIKVLPRGSLTDDTARKRFRKEALALARLNHPNIATVHEFGTQDDTDFLVTEFIPGITLDVKLARGPLPPPEVVRLGAQLAAGLAAAHQQGIIHRDLKPGNLRITTDGRLKILDFGLAQLMPHASEQGQTVTMTKSQETSGTLPYMSPEQLSGEVADARSDIWAAGTVLYEMSTGKRPFPQSVPALVINAILNQAPAAPSEQNPDVPDALDAVILKALAHQPALRYQSASELAADLERPVSATTAAAAVPRVRPPMSRGSGLKKVQLVTLAAIFLLAIGGTVFFLTRHRQQANTAPPVNRRRSVAVLGFRNLSANPDKTWLSTALAEMMTTELSQGDQLRTIPGESVAQMKVSLSLSDADSFSQPTLKRIRQNLGSDAVVVGSYLTEGNGQLRLDVRLQDAVAGETLASISEHGSEAEIDSLVTKAGAELRGKLGAGALSDAQSASVRASLPSNPEAERLYSEGLDKLRLFDALAARDALQKAATLDPTHAPTHSALAEAWSILGYDAKAKEQAKLALDLSGQSSREEKLLIEGRSHEILAELPQAIESYRALWEFFPDNVDYGLSLIHAQIAGGHANDAEATLAVLRKLNASEVDAARIDLAEGGIAASLSDFKRQQAVADRAATRGQAVGANLLAAQALQVEVEALERMGESQKVIEVSNRARDLFAAAGDRRGVARNLLIAGDLLYDEGDYEGARKKFEESVPTFREIGAEKSVRAAMERIGNVFYQEGKLQESEKYYAQVLKFDHELNDPVGLASDYGNMANALDGLGDLTGALKMQEESLTSFNQIGDRRGSSTTLNNLGNLYLEMGNLDDARKNFEQSLAMTHEIAYRRGDPYPTGGLGDLFYYSGDLAKARAQYEQALALCKEVDDGDFGAQMMMSLAAIALMEKRYADAETLAHQAIPTFEKSSAGGSDAWAQAYLARILLGAGNLKGAQSLADKAVSLSRLSALQTPRYEAILADARVKAKSGKTAEARQELEEMQASAHKFGYRLYELQARLTLGEIELSGKSSTQSAEARTQLAAVENDARALGALLIANQAQALQQGK